MSTSIIFKNCSKKIYKIVIWTILYLTRFFHSVKLGRYDYEMFTIFSQRQKVILLDENLLLSILMKSITAQNMLIATTLYQ